MAQHFVGNLAAQGPLHRDLDHGMKPPKLRQHRQQIQRSELVGSDGQLALLQLTEVCEGLLRVAAQVQQPLGVALEQLARIGQQPLAGRPVEEQLAEFPLELLDGLTHCRLRPM